MFVFDWTFVSDVFVNFLTRNVATQQHRTEGITRVCLCRRGAVVVIDSLNFPSEKHDLAELLYDLLSDHAFHKARCPILLACNKQDIALAQPATTLQEELEEEM